MAKTNNQLALEVILGQWGSGNERKQKLEAAGYNYTTVQNRVNEICEHMKTRKEAMQPWFDACKTQWEWSYNAKYNWGKWDKTITGSKNYGTCITYPNTVAMRCGLIKEKGKIITSTGSDNDSKSTQDSFYNSSLKAMASVNSKYWSSIKYPNKTTAQLVKEGKIKEGDIIGFMGHTTSYAGKDKNGNLLFNNAGHAAGIYDNNKAGSNRAVLNQKSSYMTNRKVYGVFSVNTFIVITSCTNGTITYSDRYMAGQDVTITIKPSSGKTVKSIKVDGKTVTAATSYKIKKIDANHIIEVVCETASITKKTTDQLAQEVLDGKWGSGDDRKKRLEAAGYNYTEIQNRVNAILEAKKPYQNLNANNYISSDGVCYIGQATSDENGNVTGGKAGDQKGGEVAISKWSYASGDKYNTWKYVFRAKDTAARLKIAQAVIDACKNNHIGYDQNDRKTCFKAAQKVNFDLSKITTDCELTCSELANVAIAAAGLTSYLPVSKAAYVDSLKNKLLSSSEFNYYTDSSYVSKTTKLAPGDILISGSHTAIVVKMPKAKTVDQLAQEVLDGKWGSGDARKTNLEKAGYDYQAVQNRVNQLLAVPTKQKYKGTLPTYRLVKTNAQVIADAIKWAKWIASDNNFHYGYTNKAKNADAHHNGCYFCKTQRLKKNMLTPEHTYCCNPFVGAAWAHGGCIPKALEMCQKTSSWDFGKGSGSYEKSSLFDNLGHPSKSKLKAGDVLCRETHVALYIGNGKIAEASGGDDNVKNSSKWNNSIRIKTLTDSNYANFPRVYRFNGSVNADLTMRHGEVSDRVNQWQKFLDWYFDGQFCKACGNPDGCFGDNTLKWTKKFQEAEIGKGEGDGLVGPKTLAAAAKVQK